MRIAIVGGGAAGFFLAVNLKEMRPDVDITIIERAGEVLRKVAVSGGGRCNCTNSFAGVTDLCQVYPRGHRLLKRLFNVFDFRDAYKWFEQHGVRLVTQADHCVFPASQDAQTIIRMFLSEAHRHGVTIKTGTKVNDLEDLSDYDKIVVTTGGMPRKEGWQWLAGKGIAVETPVPSLFTLEIQDKGLRSLMGTVVNEASVMIAGSKHKAKGPLLVTHWGVSGPAVLKLSSHAARYLAERNYQVTVLVNWTDQTEQDAAMLLRVLQQTHPKKQLASVSPMGLPARLWEHLLEKALGDRTDIRWEGLGKKELNRLAAILVNDPYPTSGRAAFKEEFVTCGGVSLSAVNPTTLESRVRPGLYFAGEVLDIDGVTGGFNFQAAWTTAYCVARALAEQP